MTGRNLRAGHFASRRPIFTNRFDYPPMGMHECGRFWPGEVAVVHKNKSPGDAHIIFVTKAGKRREASPHERRPIPFPTLANFWPCGRMLEPAEAEPS